jgi:hypothetical protein
VLRKMSSRWAPCPTRLGPSHLCVFITQPSQNTCAVILSVSLLPSPEEVTATRPQPFQGKHHLERRAQR